ncbi:MAG TPA: F0F1 ATP synthase subunit delta [Rhizomicrobium sp.]|nr:F0F1 ATP synthase subunit delta [Rhizomicrobium sp.]
MGSDEPHNSGLAGRYALALFELAEEQKSIEVVERDLAALQKLIAESPDLDHLVRAPVFSREVQAKGIDAVLRRMEASPLTGRFVLLLASKRRLFALADMIRAFQRLVAAKRGEIAATVTSAHPMSDAQTEELKNILKAKLGREPRLETKVDPSLLGGLVVKVGSRMIDSSLRTNLEGLRTAMRGH